MNTISSGICTESCASEHQSIKSGLGFRSELFMNTLTKAMPTPDLSDDQILGAVCGLRPCRHGGLRLEVEQLGSKKIIHNYGHGGCGVTISFGTAQIIADFVEQNANKGDRIAVLGAGVVGLTTALELLSRGYKVRIYSDKVAHETTSSIAGALWLPVGIEFGDTTTKIQQMHDILKRSQASFQALDPERYGITELPIYEPMTSGTQEHLFDNGTIAKPVEIDSFPFMCAAKPGRKFTTNFIHNNRFLSSIHEDVLNRGGEFHACRFESSQELQELAESVLVNCLALGSKMIFGDEDVYSARGVLVHLKPQDLGYGIHDGFKYMFPRENALILGGCFEEDEWDDQPDQAMIDVILAHHRQFFGQI